MKRIFTSLDIGSDTIKVVVMEYYHGKYNVLATSIVKSEGVKKGHIKDPIKASNCIKEALEKASSMLGVKIDKVLVNVPIDHARYTLVNGQIDIFENTPINGEDIAKALSAAIYNEVKEEEEFVQVLPVNFYVDEKLVGDPKGKYGSTLRMKGIMITVPKKNVYSVVRTLETIGITVVDLGVGPLSDYQVSRRKGMEEAVGLTLNIGAEKTELGIFNKGILVSSSVLEIGSKSIDNDIRYIYHVSKQDARKIKETFAVSHKRYSQVNELYETTTEQAEAIRINQYELAEIITSRLTEMLKMIKNEVNHLTNKQISYIIVTGGITELPGLKANLEMVFKNNFFVAHIDKIGVRNNAYSLALGMIKIFQDKLTLREKEYSMFDEFEEETIITTKKSTGNFSSDSVIGKVVGYFFDN